MSIMNNEQTHFDEMARQWAEDPSVLERANKQFGIVEDLVALHPGLTCLDVGGGTGALSLLVAEKTGRVTVADLSEGMISELTRKIGETGVENVIPLRIDIGKEIPSGGPFGLVYAFMSFHHIPDTEQALSHLAASQKPGGCLLIVDLDTEDGSFHSHISDFGGHNGFDRETLAAQAENAGYYVVSVSTAMTMERGEEKYPMFALLCERAG